MVLSTFNFGVFVASIGISTTTSKVRVDFGQRVCDWYKRTTNRDVVLVFIGDSDIRD